MFLISFAMNTITLITGFKAFATGLITFEIPSMIGPIILPTAPNALENIEMMGRIKGASLIPSIIAENAAFTMPPIAPRIEDMPSLKLPRAPLKSPLKSLMIPPNILTSPLKILITLATTLIMKTNEFASALIAPTRITLSTGTKVLERKSPIFLKILPKLMPSLPIPPKAALNASETSFHAALSSPITTFTRSAIDFLNFSLYLYARISIATIAKMAAVAPAGIPIFEKMFTKVLTELYIARNAPSMYIATVVKTFITTPKASRAACHAAKNLKICLTTSFSINALNAFIAFVRMLKNTSMLPDSDVTSMILLNDSIKRPNAGPDPTISLNALPRLSTAREMESRTTKFSSAVADFIMILKTFPTISAIFMKPVDACLKYSASEPSSSTAFDQSLNRSVDRSRASKII